MEQERRDRRDGIGDTFMWGNKLKKERQKNQLKLE